MVDVMPVLLLAFGGGVFAGLWARSELDNGPSLTTIALAGAAGYAAFRYWRR